MLVLGYGLSGSCQRPWGSSRCDRPDWGRMKLEEVRKVTLTSAVTSHCLSVDCGQKPGCFRSNAAEQTKHFAHLAFSYFIYSTSLKVFSISKKRFLFFIFFLLHLFFSPPPHSVLAPSRRGDLEILGYCMLQWLCGKLPWEHNLKDPVAVQAAKTK